MFFIYDIIAFEIFILKVQTCLWLECGQDNYGYKYHQLNLWCCEYYCHEFYFQKDSNFKSILN